VLLLLLLICCYGSICAIMAVAAFASAAAAVVHTAAVSFCAIFLTPFIQALEGHQTRTANSIFPLMLTL
jgi:hypothetical protein